MLAKELLPTDALDRLLIDPEEEIAVKDEGFSDAVGQVRIRLQDMDGINLGMVWSDYLLEPYRSEYSR